MLSRVELHGPRKELTEHSGISFDDALRACRKLAPCARSNGPAPATDEGHGLRAGGGDLLVHTAQAAALRLQKNATYAAFREVGRVISTVPLLRYLSDPAFRRRVTAATNRTEAFNGFSRWIGFGNRGVIADNDPVEQEKAMKFNALVINAVIFRNALDIAEIVRQLLEEGWTIAPEDLAHISPYLTEHINRFGEYSTHELASGPRSTTRSWTSTSPSSATRM
ncbi:Tn3 family transposase [Streptomyces sp. NPDC056105]|uniref:Tn3 family transposase n=1 Tax=Streptomyces sp. NPDC056105 TaxID=3345714 RepID=UPI0035E1E243